VQHFQSLRRNLLVQLGYARDVAARPVQARDEAEPNWVAARLKDNRDGRGRRTTTKSLTYRPIIDLFPLR
jgi:hypothetical protein